MKKTLSLFLALAMVLCLAIAPAMGEQSTQAAFKPFDNTVTVKVVMGYNESDIPASGAHPSTCEWNAMLKEYLNVEFDWLWEVPNTQYNTKLDLSLASGQYPDILQCDFETYCYLKDAGMLADLTDVWNQYASNALKAVIGPYLYFTTTEDGLMAIPYANNPASSVHVNYWRTDWLKKLGLEMPTTLDQYTTVIKAFRDNDPDGNGEKDTYGLSFYADPFGADLSMLPIFNAFGSYPTSWIEKDGKIVNGTIQPETKEALDYLRSLYADGYINPEFATYNADQVKTDIVSGKNGQFAGYWYLPDYNTVVESMINDENCTWSPAAMPGMTADEPANVRVGEQIASQFNVVLKSASEDAMIAMIKILNIFYDSNFPASVENGGAGIRYWTQLDANSDEYKLHSDNHYAWWCPVTIWHPGSNFAKVGLIDKYIATGEWDDDMYKETDRLKGLWEERVRILRAGRAACTTDDEISAFAQAWRHATTRFDFEDVGICSLHICDDLVKNGYYKTAVFYGAETETGLAVSTTLRDMTVQYFCRYIMGLEADDSFDTFVDNWNVMGGSIWTEEVNAAYNATH